MKQEAINTFNEGLNYDLNPIVTPNNVLTDNVNGTFITFNGNELSLQNDAGNTIINIMNANDNIPTFVPGTTYTVGSYITTTDNTNRLRYWECVFETNKSTIDAPSCWREYIVRLTEGFYPIGVQEYGGVLYIVSALNIINSSTIYQPTNIYKLNETIQTGLDQDIPGTFYISLKYNNTSNLSDATAWKNLGDINSAPNYNMVEFGSYPSPEKHFNNEGDALSINLGINQIYNPKVANELVFSPGEYVTFNSTLDSEYVTRPNPIAIDPIRLYIIKLYQQLTSGYTDLTQAIDEAFITSGSTEPHWLFDPAFKFYCPYLYRGKLLLAIEIQPLQSYSLQLQEIDYNLTSNTYSVILNVYATFTNSAYTISVGGVIVQLSLNGVILDPSNYIVTAPNNTGSEFSGQIIISGISGDNAGKLLKYSIVPNFTFSSGTNADLPVKYLEQYTINGSIILLAGNYAVYLHGDNAFIDNSCSLTLPGFRELNAIQLINEFGDSIDLGFTSSFLNYYLIRSGYTPIMMLPEFILGYFSVDSNNIIIGVTWAPLYDDTVIIDPVLMENKIKIEQAAIGMPTLIADPTCYTAPLTIIVDGSSDITINITQLGLIFIPTTNHIVTVNARIGVSVYIEIISANLSFENISDTITITSPTTLNYSLIGQLEKYQPVYDILVVWNNTIDLNNAGITMSTWNGSTSSWDNVLGIMYASSSLSKSVFSTVSQDSILYPANTIFSEYIFSDNLPVPSNYRNITPTTDFVNANGIIFRKHSLITN